MIPLLLWQQRKTLFLAPGWLACAANCPGNSPFMIPEHAESIRHIAKENRDFPGIRTTIEKISDRDQRIPRSKIDKTAQFLELDVAAVDVPNNNCTVKTAPCVAIQFHEQKSVSHYYGSTKRLSPWPTNQAPQFASRFSILRLPTCTTPIRLTVNWNCYPAKTWHSAGRHY